MLVFRSFKFLVVASGLSVRRKLQKSRFDLLDRYVGIAKNTLKTEVIVCWKA